MAQKPTFDYDYIVIGRGGGGGRRTGLETSLKSGRKE